jgi:glyoxylase-like metal-dependent hydrolase (beta-lactamase superfamily II)
VKSPERASKQLSNTYSIKVGDIRVTTLLDTFAEFPVELLAGISSDAARSRQLESLRHPRPHVTINCFLIEAGDARILVDSGTGGEPTESEARLLPELASLGLHPEDITHIFLTHLHADHAGGVASDTGKSIFPIAKIIAHEAERDFWFNEPPPDSSAPQLEQFAFTRRLVPLLPQFEWTTAGEILPGIELVHLPGHTPGHSGLRVNSKGQSLLIWGDIVHQPDLQFVSTEVGTVFDVDPKGAIETRRKAMEAAARTGELTAGMHTDFPAFGRVAQMAENVFRFVPQVWSPVHSEAIRLHPIRD